MTGDYEATELGVTHKWFEYHNLPARQLGPNSYPEVFRKGKGWQQVDDNFDFLHSYLPITEQECDAMVAQIDPNYVKSVPGSP